MDTQRTDRGSSHGGASGLGAATAEAFAAAGAKVALLDLNVAAAEQLASKLGGIAVKCDVTDEQSAVDARWPKYRKSSASAACS